MCVRGDIMTTQLDDAATPPVGALLRRPAVIVRHEVMDGLREAGFDDVLPAHLGVFQHPGPDGQRPGVLAMRTSASKQAMNHLLHQLETGGYIVREAHPDDRRTRVVRLTERGWAAQSRDPGRRWPGSSSEWYQALGEEVYAGLAHALGPPRAAVLDAEAPRPTRG